MKRISGKDWCIVLNLTGGIIFYFGFTMLIPIVIGLVTSEFNSSINFAIGFLACILTGLILKSIFKGGKEAEWIHGMSAAALSWIIVMLLSAIPYFLSGFFSSYLDACFDVMSGLTTTGLVLVQNIDHIPVSLNIWRHLLTFIGGQGIIVIALVFLPPSGLGFKSLVGEGKEERLIPSVRETGKAIWYISLIYLLIGTALYFITGLFLGMYPLRSVFHGICMFMSSWSTGGFAPQSQNTMYYHSFPFEAVCMLFSILGSMNFGLHYYLWYRKDKKDVIRDIESKTFITTLTLTGILLIYGLIREGIYSSLLSLIRKGLFILVSGHTTTGQMTIYATQFITQWGNIGLIAIMLAMAFGGYSASTAGGFKGIRTGIVFKAVIAEIKRYFLPQSGVVVEKFHHLRDAVLSEKIVKSAALIIILYILMHLVGTIVGVLNGIPIIPALFESISAGSNTGLSCGITNPNMASSLKITYIINMFLGRLEFAAVFVFILFFVRSVFKRS